MIQNNALVTLTGNLGKAPEIRRNKNGDYAFISVATTDTVQDPSGYDRPLNSVWHRVGVYNSNILERLKTLDKGHSVRIETTLDYYKHKTFKDGKELMLAEPKLIAVSLESASTKINNDDSQDDSKVTGF